MGKKNKMDFSKKLVLVVVFIFGVSLLASYTLPAIFEHMADVSIELFQITATLAGSTQIAYFGKSGFENYDKNKKKLGFIKAKDYNDSSQYTDNEDNEWYFDKTDEGGYG